MSVYQLEAGALSEPDPYGSTDRQVQAPASGWPCRRAVSRARSPALFSFKLCQRGGTAHRAQSGAGGTAQATATTCATCTLR